MKNPLKSWGVTIAAMGLFFSSTNIGAAAQQYKEKPEDGWVTYKSDDFGYSLYYPSTFFEPQAIAAQGEPKTFLSPDGAARIVVSGVDNDEDYTLGQYRSIAMDELRGNASIDYSPKGQTWFVLSGYRGNEIYYQKVMFSCDTRIINTFNIRFPVADKAFYEGLINIMEDNFRPARGVNVPARCGSRTASVQIKAPTAAPIKVAAAPVKVPAAARVKFPAGYEKTFTNYFSGDRQNGKQAARIFANDIALQGVRENGELPNGSVLAMEVFKIKTDDKDKPVVSALGRLIRGGQAALVVMQKENGWGDQYPEDLRVGDWEFAIFSSDGKRVDRDLNACRRCHAPLQDSNFLFSYEHLRQ